jgi:hypothetical protein
MLSVMKRPELIAVPDDPDVKAANEGLLAANLKKDAIEAEERRLLAIKRNADGYTADEIDEADRRLECRKGTQFNFYLPEADAAREDEKKARKKLAAATGPARQRLSAAGTAQIAEIALKAPPLLRDLRAVAQQIEQVRQQTGEGGGDPPDNPFAMFLPGGDIEFRLRNAKANGLLPE